MPQAGDNGSRRSHTAHRVSITGDYPVGYGRPPTHTRFKAGQSGNRKGRPKGSKNFRTIIENVLTGKIVVRQGEKKRSISRLEGIVWRQVDSALKGNDRAALATLKMAGEVGLLREAPSTDRSERDTPVAEM